MQKKKKMKQKRHDKVNIKEEEMRILQMKEIIRILILREGIGVTQLIEELVIYLGGINKNEGIRENKDLKRVIISSKIDRSNEVVIALDKIIINSRKKDNTKLVREVTHEKGRIIEKRILFHKMMIKNNNKREEIINMEETEIIQQEIEIIREGIGITRIREIQIIITVVKRNKLEEIMEILIE